MKAFITSVVVALGSVAFVGCASSHEEGVKSNLRSQWTMVAADTTATTDAAKDVLEDRGLKNVTGESTKVDGKVMGKKSDGTEVKVTINKEGTGSQVNVTVGTLGDPTLGAEIAKAIKVKAEGMSTKPM
jgi:Flp pilus assembly pilin Flp